MKFIYKTLLLSLFSGLVFSSCDDFVEDVDIVDPTAENSDDYLPVEFLTSVYGMHTDFSYAFSYLGITDMISDNSDKGSSPTDTGTDKRALDNLDFTSSSVSVTAMWTQWYKTVGRASQAIEIAQNYEGQTEVPNARVIGEAKFLRALNYFWLVRSFGAIPIQEIDLVERAPVDEVYAYIEQDLLDAIDALPLKSDYSSTDLGRATKGAAQGLLAKVYLYQERWQDAADMANNVITSNQYSLDPDYANIWRETGENGPGSLFEIQARGEIPQHGVQQYSQTQGARGTNGWGWGFNSPSQNLEDAFNAAGDLYGVTGDGSTTPESLFTLDKTTGAPTFQCTLGNGNDGEALGFNPMDGLFYHASGHTGANVIFETIDNSGIDPCTVTNIDITGTALEDEEIDRMIKDAEQHANEDAKKKDNQMVRLRAEEDRGKIMGYYIERKAILTNKSIDEMSLPELYEKMRSIKNKHRHWDEKKKAMEKTKEEKIDEKKEKPS